MKPELKKPIVEAARKPQKGELADLLSAIATMYSDIDLDNPDQESDYRQIKFGKKIYKVGFYFSGKDTMMIRIQNKTQ